MFGMKTEIRAHESLRWPRLWSVSGFSLSTLFTGEGEKGSSRYTIHSVGRGWLMRRNARGGRSVLGGYRLVAEFGASRELPFARAVNWLATVIGLLSFP